MKGMVLSLVLGLVVACGGKRTIAEGGGGSGVTTTPTTAATEPASRMAAVLHISLEFEVSKESPPTTQVTLVETNETGSNKRHRLGEFDGKCIDVTPEVRTTDPDVFLGFHCQPFGTQRGVLVHILQRRGRLVLLRAWLGTSKPTFDDFDQIGELPPTPTGVPLKSDHDPA
ncbi:MAG: hypothetical protein GY811_09230 [Myxococcales bacterium]|nr:hypothetical protein [Myxococcales bacterium]